MQPHTEMFDIALFVDYGKGPRKLQQHEMAIHANDTKALEKVIAGFKKGAALWRANYEPYAIATFSICRSPHGENSFNTVLLKV